MAELPQIDTASTAARRPPVEARVGVLEWFAFGDHEAVEHSLEALLPLGVRQLRTGFSWADWHRPGGEAWFAFLVERLTAHFEVLPCFHYTPPSLGERATTSAPPRDRAAYANFIDAFLERHGAHFDTVELWNEPNNGSEWDFTLDPGFFKFAEVIGNAAYWAKQLGKRVVLGGMSPIDPGWLAVMFERGLMAHIDVVGIHGFPGAWDSTNWEGWADEIGRVRAVLDAHGSDAEMWITEAGYSTWQHDEYAQVRAFVDALEAPCERLYWYALRDLSGERAANSGFHIDDREYHCGLMHYDARPKLLYRLWRDRGLSGVRDALSWTASSELVHRDSYVRTRAAIHDGAALCEARRPAIGHECTRTLVTGGAGFVGCNLARRLLESGEDVVIFDNLSRPGVERNLEWLLARFGERVTVVPADVRNRHAIADAVVGVDAVYHLAAQVAVTTSLHNPLDDFERNALGTLHLLEAVRGLERPVPVIFTSTNKVYGALGDVELERRGARWQPAEAPLRRHGIDESRPLDLYSPYGCSKGAADQYVLDYARSFGLPTAVLRMSCIYGPRQFGTEDQGWVAHFMLAAMRGEPITIYGDGHQVRDVLFVDDLVDAFLLCRKHIDALCGQAFNMGGGPQRTLSLRELLAHIEAMLGRAPQVSFDDWRVGDQRYYCSDTRRFADATGWAPRVDVERGLARLHGWLRELCGREAARLEVPGARDDSAAASPVGPA